MVYRIAKHEEMFGGDIKTVFDCQSKWQLFGFFPVGKWKTLRNNDRSKALMQYGSLRKAKQEMEKYFLRDINKDNNPFANSKRFCHYIDFDFMEYDINSFVYD